MFTDNIISTKHKNRLTGLFLAILLVCILTFTPGTTGEQTAVNVQPQLLAMAAEHPDTAVQVIIQKSDSEADGAARMDSTTIDELNMINVDVADMGAEMAVALPCDASVNWGKISWEE
jgi:hypothetical protein